MPHLPSYFRLHSTSLTSVSFHSTLLPSPHTFSQPPFRHSLNPVCTTNILIKLCNASICTSPQQRQINYHYYNLTIAAFDYHYHYVAASDHEVYNDPIALTASVYPSPFRDHTIATHTSSCHVNNFFPHASTITTTLSNHITIALNLFKLYTLLTMTPTTSNNHHNTLAQQHY